MRAKASHVRLIESSERVHVSEKAQCLYDVAQFGSDSGEMILQIGHRLSGLGFHTTFYDAAVSQAKLARDDDPIACANDGCIWSDGCCHVRKARRSRPHYRYRVDTDCVNPYSTAVGSRRAFLQESGRIVVAGATSLGIASLLAACGGGNNGTAKNNGVALPDDVQIVQRFPQNLVAGPIRMPISLASGGGLLTTGGPIATPAQLSARIMRIDGERDELVVEDLVAPRHDADLATPYWLFRTAINEPGFYRLILAGGPSDGAAFQVFARNEVAVPGIGDALPPFDTPTIDNTRDVSPLCTRQPEPCPLHEVTLRDALALGKPIAYLVGTPAHCSTGTCAPALDALISARERVGDAFTFIHAEVYSDTNATTIAPAVNAVSMNFEPALFITDASGVITARLDAVFDAVELQSVIG
jgi:hypothetical protein